MALVKKVLPAASDSSSKRKADEITNLLLDEVAVNGPVSRRESLDLNGRRASGNGESLKDLVEGNSQAENWPGGNGKSGRKRRDQGQGNGGRRTAKQIADKSNEEGEEGATYRKHCGGGEPIKSIPAAEEDERASTDTSSGDVDPANQVYRTIILLL